MQFHYIGYKPGDPDIAERAQQGESARSMGALPAQVDMLIVGCGPTGLTLAAQLVAFADITTRIVDQKPDRILVGQADGIACTGSSPFSTVLKTIGA
jgi:phenol 2-monooxygenase (NADPH)